MGGYGIVGGNLPLAAGLGLASDYKGEDAVTVCMFGDGASNTGNFGETMNLAALWSLPVVFLVENNLYGMGTSIERHSAVTDLSKKAEGYGVPGVRVDGMDVLAVRETVAEHIQLAREERQPTLVEAFTYRYRGHSAADPEVYREKEEVEEWQRKDPIETFAKRLVDERVLAEKDVEEIARRGRRGGRGRGGRVRRRLRRSRRSTRSTTTSTWSATRSRAGTRSTSARPTRTPARTSARPGSAPRSWPSAAPPTRAPGAAQPKRRGRGATEPDPRRRRRTAG